MPHTGQDAPRTGRYRCASCGQEINVNQDQHLPPCPQERKAVEWQPI